MSADTISLGDVEITRVVEWCGPFCPPRFIIPDSDEETWRRGSASKPRPKAIRPAQRSPGQG
jgi:hypothetical protein